MILIYLNLLAPIIFPLLPNIVEKVYLFDITKNYFLLCLDDFENFLPNKDDGITLISVQVDYRKDIFKMNGMIHFYNIYHELEKFIHLKRKISSICTNN